MCISCILTTVLYVIPMCVRYLLEVKKRYSVVMTVYDLISCNLSPLATVATIYVMQEDIRETVFSSFPQRLQLLLLKCTPGLGSFISSTNESYPPPATVLNEIRHKRKESKWTVIMLTSTTHDMKFCVLHNEDNPGRLWISCARHVAASQEHWRLYNESSEVLMIIWRISFSKCFFV